MLQYNTTKMLKLSNTITLKILNNLYLSKDKVTLELIFKGNLFTDFPEYKWDFKRDMN